MRWLCIMLLFPALAFAGEDCSMLGGTCKEVCASNEEAAKGAFLDCSEKEECCVKKETHKGGDIKIPIDDIESNQNYNKETYCL